LRGAAVESRGAERFGSHGGAILQCAIAMKEDSPTIVEAPPPKPLLLWDADCGFCRKWILRWQRITGDRVAYATSRAEGGRFPEIPPEAFARSVQLVLPDGSVLSGAEAVFTALAEGGRRLPLWGYRRVPGARAASEAAYALVARNRRFFSAVTRWLWGDDVTPPSYDTARWVFLRLLALVYLVAFASLAVQIDGLVGSRGILPASAFLEAGEQNLGGASYLRLPTLFWIDASDRALHLACGAGMVIAAGLLLTGVAPALCLLALWALYLSLMLIGQTFLSFQWDSLLLEAGFVAV